MKVLVLGGGYCQLNMIKRLKDDGHYIILVDYLENNPGKTFADEHHIISTFDIPAVTNLVQITSAEAIITMGTDQPVLTAAVAAGITGLPFYVGGETALSVTNKLVMKSKFDEHRIPSVNHRFISMDFKPEDIEGISFPAVIKPVDSQGQRGIFKVTGPDDIRLHLNETFSYTRENKILLEEYYPNDEITISGWVNERKATIISVVDRVTMETENRIGICIAHNYPSRHYDAYKGEIHRLTQEIVDAFGITEGPLYFQFLIGDRGILVNEVAMRIGGAYEDIAIPVFSGIDILGMVSDHIFGYDQDLAQLNNYIMPENKCMSVQMFFVKPGTISHITPIDELLSYDGVEDALFIVAEGDIVGNIENATARAGYFIISGVDYSDVMKKTDGVFNKLQILDNYGNNLIIKYSDYRNKYKFI